MGLVVLVPDRKDNVSIVLSIGNHIFSLISRGIPFVFVRMASLTCVSTASELVELVLRSLFWAHYFV